MRKFKDQKPDIRETLKEALAGKLSSEELTKKLDPTQDHENMITIIIVDPVTGEKRRYPQRSMFYTVPGKEYQGYDFLPSKPTLETE